MQEQEKSKVASAVIREAVLSNFYNKSKAVLDLQELEQQQLDKWFKCHEYSNLIVLWCKNVIVQSYLDLV